MKKILVANRGEIAVRIIRACQELNYKTVAVFSTEDSDALHTKIADESICIGPGPSINSYLSIPALMSAAEIAGVDGIHPGYGFLAESHEFADVCKKYGVNFIGPSSQHIRLLGNKVEARALAIKCGVPLFPGSEGAVKTVTEAKKIAKEIGFPIIIKAVAGGGGRGMKIVLNHDQLENQFHLAQSESQISFGCPDVFIERYSMRPRHIEIQVLGDKHGNCVHLGERDCSIQRRHQKLIEESPSPVLDENTRNEIGETALRLVKQVGYHSAGTVEFLLDELGKFYFMEVNTRIQVEHPVTELVTGRDLIKEQILIAEGHRLSFRQKDISMQGHAMECRINAEDPESFAPWPGTITGYHAPGGPGIRMDSHVYSGYRVSSLYDSMISKLIAYGRDRKECIARMKRALMELKVDGIRTNTSFHQMILEHPKFIDGDISTKFVDDIKKKK